MKTMKTKIGVVVIIMTAMLGCDGLLDTDPKQSIDAEQALTNAENVKSVLIGAYDSVGDDDLYGGWLMMTADFLAADDEFDFTGTFFGPRQIWLKQQEYDNSQLTATWIAAYDAINILNNVLSGLDLLEEDDRDRVEGEAKLLRAMVYFDLIRLYAPTYESGAANSGPGVPLVLTPTREINDDSNVERAPVAEVYQQILSDLTSARDLLPDVNPVRSYYGNSMVASAVLSRVHLQMGNYSDARDEASRVIESGNYALTDTYAGAFNNTENSSEDIFAMQNSAQDGVNSMFTFYSADSRGDVDINQAHLDEYESGDARLDLFYSDPSNGATRAGKWEDGVNGNVNLIRLAEMYLTRAEANFRLSQAVGDTPANDLNRIRARADLGPVLLPDLDDILRERKLELMFEGNLLHDLKRTQRGVGSRPYDDDELVLPVPRRELDANPNLCQNSGYQGTSC